MPFSRLRLWTTNAFIAAVLLCIGFDMLPQSPLAVRVALHPLLIRLALNQGTWTLFAPDPDRVNTRVSAEITYRDGVQKTWHGPNRRMESAWTKWLGHRHREWLDHIISQSSAQAWEPWCHWLARHQRPDMSDPDRGAQIRIIYQESPIPLAGLRPWTSFRDPGKFDDGWVLTIEQLE